MTLGRPAASAMISLIAERRIPAARRDGCRNGAADGCIEAWLHIQIVQARF